MKRVFKYDKKYLYWGVTAFLVIAGAVLFYMALNYLPAVWKIIKGFMKILSPFVWGLIISYLLTPGMLYLEKKVFLKLGHKLHKKDEKKADKAARGMSVFLMIIVFLAVISALIYLIIPQLYLSLETIVRNSSVYIDVATNWVQKTLEDYPEIEAYAMNAVSNMNESIVKWISADVLPSLGSVITNVTAGVYYVLLTLYNLFVGIVVSVYVMGNTETVSANAKKLLYSMFEIDIAGKILKAIRFTDKTFMGFIVGKLLDSAIIGFICYIVCTILGMPYALLVSVIVGVTNVIPFFGPFIGAIPSALIILLTDPLKCLIFVIFIFILQQVDGNIIGPKILGSSVGINGFWVMFSIIIGAGIFGFWGMLLGVPVFVVIYTGVTFLVRRGLRRRGLSQETDDYKDLERIDTDTREFVRTVPEQDITETRR